MAVEIDSYGNATQIDSDWTTTNSITTIDTNLINNGTVSVNGTTNSVHWAVPNPTKLVFDIGDETIEFSGKELLRLKEMLGRWIEEKHPEDLL